MMKEINEVWAGWQPESLIGEGGFGKVYKARKTLFGEETWSAIKVIHIPNDPAEIAEMRASGMSAANIQEYYKASVKQLVNEIKLMDKMKTASHIVTIEDYEVEEETETLGWTIYIRMELLTNLATHIKEKGMMTPDIIQMGIDILTGLEFCHESNLIHRDIKPGNIFVSDFGEYKIGDFGISKEIERTSTTLSQKGTKTYMAPEIIRMEPYGKLVDIYALGLTLYEICNHGRMPFLPPFPQPYFPMDREKAILQRLEGKPLPEIAGIGRLNDIIMKACAFDPKDRYQSAAEMKADLQALAKEQPQPSKQPEQPKDADIDKTVYSVGIDNLNDIEKFLKGMKTGDKPDDTPKEPSSVPKPEEPSKPEEEKKYKIDKEQILAYVLQKFWENEGIRLQDDSLTLMRVQEACVKAQVVMEKEGEYHMEIPYITITDEGAKNLDMMIFAENLISSEDGSDNSSAGGNKNEDSLQQFCINCKNIAYLFFPHGYFCPSCHQLFLTKETEKSLEMKEIWDDTVSLGTPEERVFFYRRLLKVDENSAQVHLRLAGSLQELGKKADAFQHLQEAVKLDKRDAAIYHQLASYYIEQNDYQMAFSHEEKAYDLWQKGQCTINSVEKMMYQNFALYYEKQGDSKRAFEFLIKAKKAGLPVAAVDSLIKNYQIGLAYTRAQISEIIEAHRADFGFGNKKNLSEQPNNKIREMFGIPANEIIYQHISPMKGGAMRGMVLAADRFYFCSEKEPQGYFVINYIHLSYNRNISQDGKNIVISNVFSKKAGATGDAVISVGGDAANSMQVLQEIQQLYTVE
ncbi:protein kinase [uncultured Eubacterium sp.]|uniref:serine/threonine-protein kinase n=1 Tax=uncultured Eubacterium sp. TaxID=165185 RepID=UPI0025D99A61|nr:protein kinase [uncultured Eubacterium sp.]